MAPAGRRRPGGAPTVLLVIAAGAVLAATAAAAPGRIVLGRAIGPIAIGEERATLEVRHGPGGVLSSRPNPELPANPNFVIQVVRFPGVAVNVRFPTAEASTAGDRITTQAARYRTPRGIGVGSSRAALVARHPAAVCSVTICRIGMKASGRTVTRFHLRANSLEGRDRAPLNRRGQARRGGFPSASARSGCQRRKCSWCCGVQAPGG